MATLTGIARKRFMASKAIVDELFKEDNLDKTLEELEKLKRIIKIIEKETKNDTCSTAGLTEIILYAQAYAANIKSWETI